MKNSCLLFSTCLLLTSGCAYLSKPNPQAESNPAYLRGKSPVAESADDIIVDLSRDSSQRGTRVTATLITEPLVRTIEKDQQFRENLSKRATTRRINNALNSYVRGKTCFYLTLRSTDLNAPKWKYWSATLKDDRGRLHSMSIRANNDHQEHVALSDFAKGDLVMKHQNFGVACAKTTVRNLNDMQLRLEPRYADSLSNYELSWFTEEKIAQIKKDKIQSSYSSVKK